jgi:hypothetical protein
VRNRFRVVVADASAIPVLTGRLTSQGVQIGTVEKPPPSLEDAFVSVIADRRGAAGTPGAGARG